MIGLVRCADVQHSLPHQLSQLQAQSSGWSIADMLAHICAARRQIRSHRRRLMKIRSMTTKITLGAEYLQ